jgi:hypothetical protein
VGGYDDTLDHPLADHLPLAAQRAAGRGRGGVPPAVARGGAAARGGRGVVHSSTQAAGTTRMAEHRSRLGSLLHGHPLGDLTLGLEGGDSGLEEEMDEEVWNAADGLEAVAAAMGVRSATVSALHRLATEGAASPPTADFVVATSSGSGAGWVRVARARAAAQQQRGAAAAAGVPAGTPQPAAASAGARDARHHEDEDDDRSSWDSESWSEGEGRQQRPGAAGASQALSSASCTDMEDGDEGDHEGGAGRGRSRRQHRHAPKPEPGASALEAYLDHMGAPRVGGDPAQRGSAPAVGRCSFGDSGDSFVEQHW